VAPEPLEPLRASTTEAVTQQTAVIMYALEKLPIVQAFQVRISGARWMKTHERSPCGRRQPAAILKRVERTNFQPVKLPRH
jgi:hypothetical protein